MRAVKNENVSASVKFLHNTGNIGLLILNKDWSATSIGTINTWPETLRITLRIMLSSKFPMFLWWGPDLICFYNDAYRPSLGKNGKHPHILGMTAKEAWEEIWDTINPQIESVLNTGIAVSFEDKLIPIYRNGKIEDVYWTYSYSPVFDETEQVAGILVICTETTETINTIKLLELNSKRYYDNIMQSPVPICIFKGPDHVFEIANDLMLKLISRSSDQIINKKLFDAIPEARGQGLEEIIDDVYRSGNKFTAQELPVKLIRNRKLETIYIKVALEAIRDQDATITGITAVVSEVTYHVKIRKEIEASELRFSTLANKLPELIWECDAQGNPTFISNRWIEYAGVLPIDDITFTQIIHPDDSSKAKSDWEDCLRNGKKYQCQIRLKDAREQYHWFDGYAEPVKNEDDEIVRWIGTFKNIHNQKKAEEFLINAYNRIEESEKRFRKVANEAPVFIWMSGTDKLRYFFNTAWLDFTGRTEQEEFGNGWTEGVHPDDLENCISIYNSAFQSQTEYTMEYRLKRHDGVYRWINAKGIPRFSPDGEFEGFIGACLEIHDRKMYEQKLMEKDAKLNIIINASELGTWELNLKTKEVVVSKRYLEILGYQEETSLTHEEILEHLHPGDLAIREKAFEEAYKTGILFYRSRIIWKDKTLHWMEGKGKVFFDELNNPVKLVGTVRDITEETNYQQNLREREFKFRLLADSMPQFVWTSDAEGNINYCNQSILEYSRLPEENLKNNFWEKVLHPDDISNNGSAWNEAIAKGSNFLFEHRFARHDGEYRWQLSRAVPHRDFLGNIQMWIGTSTDIHDIRSLDQQKDYFINMASHELKTPLTSIKGYVQILQSMYHEKGDDFLNNSLQKLDNQIGKLTKLITELLDISKIKSGKLFLTKQDFYINKLIEEIIEDIAQIHPEHLITFQKNKDALIHADKIRIGQVLTNFLTNAVKYAPGSFTIKVNSNITDNEVTISVEDSGIGIAKKDQEKIFERFYRVSGKNEKTFPGFGIGLFIAAEIIQRHQGKIGMRSAPVKGSIFYFSLPFIETK